MPVPEPDPKPDPEPEPEPGDAEVGAGADGGAIVNGGGGVADQQMVQPARVTELSLRHVKTEPAATATPLGPVRP